jgi:transposase
LRRRLIERMFNDRKPYPSDVTDEEWSLVVPYLTLMCENAPQSEYPLRDLFNGLRYVIHYGIAWRAMPNDLPLGRRSISSPNAGLPPVASRLWHRICAPSCGLRVTPANVDDRVEVGHLAEAIQDVTGESVTLVYVDQGYTGASAAEAARVQGIELRVAKRPEAKRGFVLLPRAGVSSDLSPGQPDVADWSRITNAMPRPSQDSMSLLSSALCSQGQLTCSEVHNTLLAISSRPWRLGPA